MIKELEGLKIPTHIAIILDGNRRYAKKNLKNPLEGHDKGAETLLSLIEWIGEIKEIKNLTAYTFSIKNFKRDSKEVNHLMSLFMKFFNKFRKDKRIKENGIRINFIGRLGLFPENIQKLMKEMMEDTKKYSNYEINFAMGYGGRQEITDCVKKIGEKIKSGELSLQDVDESIVGDNMYMNDDVDLIIRTSGEKRTSDFLPWQGHYAEWFFIEKYWPEFTRNDLIEIIKEFNERQRRFGK